MIEAPCTDTPQEYRSNHAGSPCEGPAAGAILRGPPAPGRPKAASGMFREEPPGADGRRQVQARRARPRHGSPSPRPWPPHPIDHPTTNHRSAHRMDAKQVWRAALGELQVALSPANYETWLRDTQLVDVDDNRFRISVPNGFAKDWLDTRYRSLISQTLARIVGYSVQVEFVVRSGPPAGAGGSETPARGATTGPTQPSAPRSDSSRPGSAGKAGRPASTPATPSRTSSSGRRTAWPMRPACPSPSAPGTPTTRSSCTAGWASARPT